MNSGRALLHDPMLADSGPIPDSLASLGFRNDGV
jgi:hypothetical protein